MFSHAHFFTLSTIQTFTHIAGIARIVHALASMCGCMLQLFAYALPGMNAAVRLLQLAVFGNPIVLKTRDSTSAVP